VPPAMLHHPLQRAVGLGPCPMSPPFGRTRPGSVGPPLHGVDVAEVHAPGRDAVRTLAAAHADFDRYRQAPAFHDADDGATTARRDGARQLAGTDGDERW